MARGQTIKVMANLCSILDGVFGILEHIFGIWACIFESGWVGRMAPGQTAKFKVGFAHKITTSPHCGEKLLQNFFF